MSIEELLFEGLMLILRYDLRKFYYLIWLCLFSYKEGILYMN